MSTTTNKGAGSCHPMVSVPEALQQVLKETARVLISTPEKDRILTLDGNTPVKEILGQTLVRDLTMPEPGYPNYTASIMDGYAVQSNTTSVEPDDSGWTHAVVGKVYAGNAAQATETVSSLPKAYYVTTGARVPDNYDCVVPIEQVHVAPDGSRLAVQSTVVLQDGKWLRRPGCDIAAGDVVLPSGHVMDAVAIGLWKQAGSPPLHISRPLKVGVLSTGNELGESSSEGTIPDVNRPILLSLLATLGFPVEPVDLGICRDDRVDVMVERMKAALADCQVIITTGGISMGETDMMEEVLLQHLGGTLHFGRLHMKPGKPTTFVAVPVESTNRLVFALPGNPVSATVCTHLLVRPCLDLLYEGPDTTADTHGESVDEYLRRIVQNARVLQERQAILTSDLKLDIERPEYHRVMLTTDPSGRLLATSTGVQRSSRLMSLRDAEGLLVLPQGSSLKPSAKSGETYTVLLLRGDRRERPTLRGSKHIKRSLKVGILQVGEVLDSTLEERVQKAMSGSKSGSVSITSHHIYTGPVTDVVRFLQQEPADIRVVVSSRNDFVQHLEVSAILRTGLAKVADSMALQARRGAAAQDPVSALFEVTICYCPKSKQLIIYLPTSGLDQGLGNVRGLLKHALQIARDSGVTH